MKLSQGFFSLSILSALTACNGLPQGQVQGQDVMVHLPITLPSATPDPNSTPTPVPSPTPIPSPTDLPVGSSCHSGDTSKYCIGLKYVVYEDSSAKPVVSQSGALSNLATINQIWSQCKISFQIDEYLVTDPTQQKLRFNTANDSELDQIRNAYDDGLHFLVVTTGTWDRSGTLGNTGANAWTNLPGDAIFGSILESPVGIYPNIIAHELGHYMNLNHVSDTGDLMNPIIYDGSTNLYTSQCSIARASLASYWTQVLR